MADNNHSWTVQSRHLTSEGTVTYLRCSCGRFRIKTDRSTERIEFDSSAAPDAMLVS